MKNLLCYVFMPFDTAFDSVLETIEHAIRFAVDDCEIECKRLDRSHESVLLDEELEKAFRTADFFVVDVTGPNPNVMWELGYVTALGKPRILIAQDQPTFPFNIDHWRRLRYDNAKRAALANQIRAGVREIVAKLEVSMSTPDFERMNDDVLLEYLDRTLPLRDRPEVIEHFSAQGNPIVSNFLKYYWNEYMRGILGARVNKLPLPSRERQEVAINMLLSAQHHIRAITIPAKDQWLRKNTPYFHANIAAARKVSDGLTFKRLVVFPDSSSPDPRHPLNDPEQAYVIELYRKAGIEIVEGFESDIQSFLADTFKDHFKLQNLLIVDNRIMTRADEANHGGKLITSPEEIRRTIADFDSIWKFVEGRERPPRSQA